MLKCICDDSGRDWADVAGLAAGAYRAAKHESTGFTPNRMLFGRENSMPLDLVYGKPLEVAQCKTEYAYWLANALLFTHQEARKRLGEKLRAQKHYYDRRIKPREFSVGDKVLWLRPRVKKLENVWQGPYEVKNKLPERHYYTIGREGKTRRATAEQLRPYHTAEDLSDGHVTDDVEGQRSEVDADVGPEEQQQTESSSDVNPLIDHSLNAEIVRKDSVSL